MCLLSSAKNELLNIDILKLIHKIRLSPFLTKEQSKKDKVELERIFKLAPTIVELSHLYEEKTK